MNEWKINANWGKDESMKWNHQIPFLLQEDQRGEKILEWNLHFVNIHKRMEQNNLSKIAILHKPTASIRSFKLIEWITNNKKKKK